MIYLDIASIERSANDVYTGKISFYINEEYFPEKNWNDRIFPLINWWGDAILNFNDRSESTEFLFMDGPFSVNLISNAGFSLVQLRNGSNVTQELEYLTAKLKEELVDGFLEVAQLLLTFLRDKKCFSDEIKELETNYRTLVNR